MIGAILTQNTAWANVERAIGNLRRAKLLSWEALRGVATEDLAGIILPSGTFRVKARRLKAFVDALWRDHGGSLPAMLSGAMETVRARLLAIHGIGPETADAILLYAGEHPSFVVDTYTQRILRRHFMIEAGASYEATRGLFQQNLPSDARMFNEYHALLVRLGKLHCQPVARCDGCPLALMPHDAQG